MGVAWIARHAGMLRTTCAATCCLCRQLWDARRRASMLDVDRCLARRVGCRGSYGERRKGGRPNRAKLQPTRQKKAKRFRNQDASTYLSTPPYFSKSVRHTKIFHSYVSLYKARRACNSCISSRRYIQDYDSMATSEIPCTRNCRLLINLFS